MSVKHLGVQEARRAQVEDGYTYVDVRSVPEYESGHPAGAHNVPLLHMNSETRQMLPNPDFLAVMQANYQADARLLIGCQVGGRSSRAAQLLVEAGYEAVVNVRGGFGGHRDPATGQVIDEGWASAGLPVETTGSDDVGYTALHGTANTSTD